MATEVPQPVTKASSRPPALINKAIVGLLRSPLHGLLSKQLMLVTFRGRKTGNHYTTPVTLIRNGDGYRFFTSYNWWKNMRGGAPVTLLVQRQPFAGFATPNDDPETVLREAKAYLAANGLKNAWRIGLRIDPKREPGDAELRQLLGKHVVVDVHPA